MGKGQDVTLRVERQPASKRRLLRLLDELESSGLYDSTLYVGPGESGRVRLPHIASEALSALSAEETGAAVFAGEGARLPSLRRFRWMDPARMATSRRHRCAN